jgi:hypothetical protein
MPHCLSSRRAAAAVTLRATPARKGDIQATRVRRRVGQSAGPLRPDQWCSDSSGELDFMCRRQFWAGSQPSEGGVGDAAQLRDPALAAEQRCGGAWCAIPGHLGAVGCDAVIALMISLFAAASARRLRRDQIRVLC